MFCAEMKFTPRWCKGQKNGHPEGEKPTAQLHGLDGEAEAVDAEDADGFAFA